MFYFTWSTYPLRFHLLCKIFLILGVCLLFNDTTAGQNYQKISISENKNTHHIELSNGLLGIVIPSDKEFKNGNRPPAPIQSFIYSDGTYSDSTVNYLVTPSLAIFMKTTIVSNTGTEVIVKIEYRFNKSKVTYVSPTLKGTEAGPGFYIFTVKLKKGEKSIIIEEDTDFDIAYNVNVSNGLFPDKARYRGWSSSSIKDGYEEPGIIYRSEDERQFPLDATLDINYGKPFTYPKLILWEPAGGEQSSGRYWQLFNSKAKEDGALFGFFQGPPRRLIGAKSVGPALDILPVDAINKIQRAAELKMEIYRRGPDNSWYPRKRFQWVVFISTKADLNSPEKIQAIGKELNKISGLGSVINAYADKPVKLVPAFYNGAIYMGADKINALCKTVKNNFDFYNKLLQTDGGYAWIWDMWRYPDSARSRISYFIELEKKLKNEYILGEGTYNSGFRYWHGSLKFKFYAICISCLFADKSISISDEEKVKLEKLVGLMGRILWDDNNVPFFDSSGVNYGPANMSFQYRNDGRFFFSLLMANDNEFATRAMEVARLVNMDLNAAIYQNGSSFGSPHYTQATLEPILFSMLQLKQAGIQDLFITNNKVVSFARFYSCLLTPPSCRFGGNRKLISFGDGSEESSACFALLATGLQNIDSVLSKELISSYHYGPPRNSIHGSPHLASDFTSSIPKAFSSGTGSYDGYLTHMRSGINSVNETALWILNGNKLQDHRNDDDGEVAIYALQAPLSLSRSSFYFPSASDARIRNMVIPEEMFSEWYSENQPISERSITNRTWKESELKEFAQLGMSTCALVLMSMQNGIQWYRKLFMINIHEDLPIIVFYDSVCGPANNIWSIMMMSEGPVNTPVGNITPERRIYNNNDIRQLPKGTAIKRISAGLNRFLFNGQQWPAHFSGGIDCLLYTISSDAMEFSLADWGTTWQNTEEQNEFKTTNQKSYVEEQQIFRLRSNRPFFTVLLPYFKGTDPYRNRVDQMGKENIIRLRQMEDEIVIQPDGYYCYSANQFKMGLLDRNGNMEGKGISIHGGYTELEYSGNQVAIRVHGNKGRRKITFPFKVKPEKTDTNVSVQMVKNGSAVTIEYLGGNLNLQSGKKGYNEYRFNIN